MSNLSDVAAERAIVAALILYGKDAITMCQQKHLSYEDFNTEFYQTFYAVLSDILVKKDLEKIDQQTVLSTAQSLGHNEFITQLRSNPDRYDTVCATDIHLGSIEELAARVKKWSIVRSTIRLLDKTKSDLMSLTGDEAFTEIYTKYEDGHMEILKGMMTPDSKVEKLSDGFEEYIRELARQKPKILGIPTGFDKYDELIGGGLRTGVHVVSARKKEGKSIFALNVGINVASKGDVGVLYMDTEMPKDLQNIRTASALTGIPIKRVEMGQWDLTDEDLLAMENAFKKVKDMPFYWVSANGWSIEQVLAYMSRWIESEGKKFTKNVIIYDYIKLTTAKDLSKRMQEYQVIGFLMTELHNFAVRHEIPILATVQKNRDMDIAQSDRISWLYTSGAEIVSKDAIEMACHGEYGNMKLRIEDARLGPANELGDFINLRAAKWKCEFKEGPLHSDVKMAIEARLDAQKTKKATKTNKNTRGGESEDS